MKCPRDSQTLVFVDDGRHLRHRCPDCEGLLLDRDELLAAFGRRPGRALVLPQERIAALPDGAVACPRDGTSMRRLVHRGVELDLCPGCGALWLDAGELEAVRARPAAAAAAAAGLAAAGAAVAATPAEKPSLVSGLGEAAAEIAVEGAIDVVFDFAVDAVGSLLGGL